MQLKLFFACCIFLAGLLTSTTWTAATVYKCTGPEGSTVFSETPCGKDAQELELGPTESLPQPIEIAPIATVPEEKAPAKVVAAPQSFAPTEYPSYRCSTPDGMVFYRHQHCPKNVQVTVAGVYGNIPTETQTFAPVEEAGVSREIACKAIYPLVADHRYGERNDERYSTVERNQGKDPCR
jgi:Domain of unknown function (DUF4124)